MVFERVPSHAREAKELRDSRCTGYCRHLDFRPDASDEVLDLTFRMVLASLGSQNRGAVKSRGLGVISGTQYLIVADYFVGVCCTSLKKICGIIKKHILGADDDSEQGTGRNHTYDAMVEPAYR